MELSTAGGTELMESQQRFGVGAELPDDDRPSDRPSDHEPAAEPECAGGPDRAPEYGLHAVLAPADLGAIAPLRAALRAALRRWGVPELADTAELLASELLANALQHTGGGAALEARLGLDGRLRVEVRDGGARLPQLPRPRRAPETATSGRGLLLVEVLADGWGVRRHADGKITWFELAPPRPQPGRRAAGT